MYSFYIKSTADNLKLKNPGEKFNLQKVQISRILTNQRQEEKKSKVNPRSQCNFYFKEYKIMHRYDTHIKIIRVKILQLNFEVKCSI